VKLNPKKLDWCVMSAMTSRYYLDDDEDWTAGPLVEAECDGCKKSIQVADIPFDAAWCKECTPK
jgi:hypothetical protein